MDTNTEAFLALAEALGIGLLIGLERERSLRGADADLNVASSAGIRTFALASLMGAISMMVGGIPLLAVAVIVTAAARIVFVFKETGSATGLTTSFALFTVVLLGALATEKTLLAAGVAVVIASILAAREILHDFSKSVLSAVEVRDGLILAVSILVILPILPDRDFGPANTLNLRDLFVIVVLVMMIGAAGHIASRLVGARLGLPIGGLLSGLVSSTATIAALGRRAADSPGDAKSAASGAVLSSVSSLAQIGVILIALSPAMFAAGLPLLIGTGVVAGAHGAVIFFTNIRDQSQPARLELPSRVFSVLGALQFAFIVAAVLLASTVLNSAFGDTAIIATVSLAGLASTNSAGVALASLVAAGEISAWAGTLPLAAALSANTMVRIWIAKRTGIGTFSRPVIGGLLLQMAGLWLAWWLGPVLWKFA